ncbi:MAG TPA: twin-arginine translocase TatA/TatE family subunit [Gemmatimonadaceae bacterium]|nr:twin-arginine translocase TatA/TatE family subunit [Gemmatimonadaceae bacterium]
MPFGLGPGELILGLLIVLLLFGAKRIPEIAGSFGKGIKEFKRNMSEAERAIRDPESGDRSNVETRRADQRLATGGEPPVPRDDEPAPPEPKRLLS